MDVLVRVLRVRSVSGNPVVCNSPEAFTNVATLLRTEAYVWHLRLEFGKLTSRGIFHEAYYCRMFARSSSKMYEYEKCFAHCWTKALILRFRQRRILCLCYVYIYILYIYYIYIYYIYITYIYIIYIYRVSQEECTKLRESVPYVKLYRYNPKHL